MVSFGSFTHTVSETDQGTLLGLPLNDVAEMLRLEKVDWIKIDVEGSEIKALEGATQILAKHKPDIWMEFHLPFHEIEEALKKVGYVVKERLDIRENFGSVWAVPW